MFPRKELIRSGTVWNLDVINQLTFQGVPVVPGGGGGGGAGTDGREVELQANATHLQWRYVGTATWTDLVPLSTITGPQGATGAAGAAGQGVPTGGTAGQTLVKVSGTDYDTAWGPRFSYGTSAPTGGQDGDWYAQLI